MPRAGDTASITELRARVAELERERELLDAIANIAKYAGATSVSVRVTATDASLLAEIADDGAGGADASAGTGLRGLADRMAALDGTFAVDSPPGEGTRIRAEIPLSSL